MRNQACNETQIPIFSFFPLPYFTTKGPSKSIAHLEKARNGNANRI